MSLEWIKLYQAAGAFKTFLRKAFPWVPLKASPVKDTRQRVMLSVRLNYFPGNKAVRLGGDADLQSCSWKESVFEGRRKRKGFSLLFLFTP